MNGRQQEVCVRAVLPGIGLHRKPQTLAFIFCDNLFNSDGEISLTVSGLAGDLVFQTTACCVLCLAPYLK